MGRTIATAVSSLQASKSLVPQYFLVQNSLVPSITKLPVYLSKMTYSDNKHDDNMEAGLLSTHQEEERMLLKEALYLDDDEESTPYMEPSHKTSPARRILMALGICFLVGIALVSIGSATGVCPGHLRHTNTGEVSIKDAVHRHNPNLSHAMGHMAKRQNTPSASETVSETTQESTQPTSTSETQETTTSQPPVTTDDTATTTQDNETTATTEEPQSTEENSSTDSGDETTHQTTQAVITGTGTKTTSSAVPKTFTSTLPDGGVTTLTSTSWVQVLPAATSTSGPNLQNAAPQHSIHGILTGAIGMVLGGLLLL